MMMPTADEIARVIIAAFRMVQADPLRIADRLPRGQHDRHNRAIVEGRGYASLALRKLFPNLTSRTIARFVGVPEDTGFILKTYDNWQKGALRWYDEIDFRRILKNCAVDPRKARQVVIDETTRPFREPTSPTSPSVRFGSKKRLEDELRQAVENTARMQARGEER